MFQKTKRVFLDYASTTPTDPRVLKEMKPFFGQDFFNPSAIYEEGVAVAKVLEQCRRRIADVLQAKPSELIFTGNGTEADNLAVMGVARRAARELAAKEVEGKPHIITTAIEHVAVLEACAQLEKEGFEVTYIQPNNDGVVSTEEVVAAIRPETVLISVMLANNEIGTIQPVRQIGVAVQKYKKSNQRGVSQFPFFHTDASQAPNYLGVNVDALNVDLMTLDGSKIYGPKGIGMLFCKSYVSLDSILYGGGQEDGRRPGTENVPGIVGLTKALEIAADMREAESLRLEKLQLFFLKQLAAEIPSAKLNGGIKNRLPNNINICIDGLNSEFAVLQLDEAGVSCAAMTACKNLAGEMSSYVIQAIEEKEGSCAKSSLRFSMGRGTTKKDVERAVQTLTNII